MHAKKMTLLAALLAAASVANADTPQVNFNVEAVIPATDFYVTPVNGWDAQTQQMTWNAANDSLNAFSQQLQMKNSGGGHSGLSRRAACPQLGQRYGYHRPPGQYCRQVITG